MDPYKPPPAIEDDGVQESVPHWKPSGFTMGDRIVAVIGLLFMLAVFFVAAVCFLAA